MCEDDESAKQESDARGDGTDAIVAAWNINGAVVTGGDGAEGKDAADDLILYDAQHGEPEDRERIRCIRGLAFVV